MALRKSEGDFCSICEYGAKTATINRAVFVILCFIVLCFIVLCSVFVPSSGINVCSFLCRYDLDGNGRITREELYALLTHIPAAFKVLHQLAGPVIGFVSDG